MALRFYNTLTQQVEPFAPLHDNVVRMYTCGPTVYNYVHIGNLRTFTFQDILRRWLQVRGYQLDHVMNITDVEDKIIRNASAEHKSIAEYTEKYTQAFLEDTAALRLQRPERLAKATDHIPRHGARHQDLERMGHTYQSDGSIYYRISNFPGYGKLSHNDFSGIRAGARVDVDEYDKANARDFVLWKAPKDGEPFWDSRYRAGSARLAHRMFRDGDEVSGRDAGHSRGRRRPGVSASRKRDRAVGSAHFGKPFARFWLHSEFLIVEGQKMSKSARQFLYPARPAGAGLRTRTHPLSAGLGSLPQEVELHFRWAEIRDDGD